MTIAHANCAGEVRPTQVRKATEPDTRHIAALEAALFPDAWSATALRSYVTGSETPAGRAAWVAGVVVPHRAVVGYLLISWVLDEGTIDRIGVSPDYQRQGIGRQLLGTGLRALAEQGIGQAWLEVGASNEAAIRLYESAGFTVMDRRRGYYVGPPPDDALVMMKVVS